MHKTGVCDCRPSATLLLGFRAEGRAAAPGVVVTPTRLITASTTAAAAAAVLGLLHLIANHIVEIMSAQTTPPQLLQKQNDNSSTVGRVCKGRRRRP